MFMDNPGVVPGQLDEEFSRPVESIMRCEDFKSNFARRLSNRYTSRSPVAKRHPPLKLPTADNETVDNAPGKIEHCSQLSKMKNMEQNDEAGRPPDIQLKNHTIRDTEMGALNMEIETLRWQLAQTEANRQMHIALLKQIVTFLSRVKNHIELQNPELELKKEITPSTDALSKAVKVTELPRSRSVLHVNKHEYSLSANKKLSTRKISKSISNVNGYKEFNGAWNQSKLSLTPDTEGAQKINEEISRLISLANTVLSTKLPDLAYKCNNSNNKPKVARIYDSDTIEINDSSLNFIDDDVTNAFILNTIYDSEDAFKSLTHKFVDVKDESLCDFIVNSSPLSCGMKNDFASVHINDINGPFESINIQKESKTRTANKRSEYTHVANFIEDESGFSSMSSFQEIGIPIISIIPPSPCKEVEYIDEFTDILDEAEKWKSDTKDKQTMKVFWV